MKLDKDFHKKLDFMFEKSEKELQYYINNKTYENFSLSILGMCAEMLRMVCDYENATELANSYLLAIKKEVEKRSKL